MHSVPLGGAVHECATGGGGRAVHECATVHMSRPDADCDCWLLGTEQMKGRRCSMNLRLCWMLTVISS